MVPVVRLDRPALTRRAVLAEIRMRRPRLRLDRLEAEAPSGQGQADAGASGPARLGHLDD